MMAIGVASPSAHGQAMMSTAMALSSASAKRGSGPQTYQRSEGDDGHDDYRRHEPGRHGVGEPLNRRARALRLADHPDDLRQHGLAPDALGAHDEAPRAVDRRARDPLSRFFDDRHRLAREHRLVDVRCGPRRRAPSVGIFSPGPNAQAIAQPDVRHRLVELLAVADDARRSRREVEQLPDRGARAAARPQLENLAEEHEDGDHDRGIEVGLDRAVHAEARRKDLRREGRGDAEQPGGADAERDEREHVG